MKEASKELLLAEYDRLKTVEQYRLGIYDHSLQFYLTVITAAVGALLFIMGSYSMVGYSRAIIIILLTTVSFLGVVTHLRLVNEDIKVLQLSRRYQLIRDAFIKEDSALVNAFPKMLIQSPEEIRSWSSIRGIIRRALSTTSVKTIVVLLNCVIAVVIGIIILLPVTFWAGLVISIIIATPVAFGHAAYASWRYQDISKQPSKDVFGLWM
jgi:hypothetical protein